jgi:hypothetical protein
MSNNLIKIVFSINWMNFAMLVCLIGKTPLILKEIWVFPDLDGNSPFIFHTQ